MSRATIAQAFMKGGLRMSKSALKVQPVEKLLYMDMREFRSHFPVSDNCFRLWIRHGKVPPPIKRLGKLLWARNVVEQFLQDLADIGKEAKNGADKS
jgi:hypothetical protein